MGLGGAAREIWLGDFKGIPVGSDGMGNGRLLWKYLDVPEGAAIAAESEKDPQPPRSPEPRVEEDPAKPPPTAIPLYPFSRRIKSPPLLDGSI